MERFNELENIGSIENKIFSSLNLLELAKTYCEHNYDKADEILVLNSVLEIVLNNQKEVIREFDSLVS